MKLKILAIGIVIIVASLSGCIGEKDATDGTYRCDADNGILYLQNGEYEMLIDEVHGGGGAFGKYSVKDGMVLLKMEFLGIIIPLTIDSRNLIDPDGDRWVRD